MTRANGLAIAAAAYDAQVAVHGLGARPWGRALRRWHVVKRIVWPVMVRWWDHDRDGRLSRATPRQLGELVEKHWDDIEALCQAGILLSAFALEDLAARGHRVPPGELSERVAVRTGAAYRERGVIPGAGELRELTVDVVESYLRARSPKLTRAEFAAGVADYYDGEWHRRGAGHLAAFRPSLVGLGQDVRPPLAPDKEPGGWHLGLGRSVWGRYRLHTIKSATSRTSSPGDANCTSHDEHERPRDLGGTAQIELAREEARRACSPYGLAAVAHQGVVLAISHGLDLSESVAGGSERTRSWREWRTVRCAPLAAEIGPTAASSRPDEALIAAIRDYAGLWRATPAGKLLEHRYGPLTGRLEAVHRAVARKTWMDLHRREREFVEPMRRAHVARSLQVAFCRGVPEELQRNPDGYRYEPSTEGEKPEVLDVERRYMTFDVLLDYADEVASWHRVILAGNPSWFQRYEEIIYTAPEPAERYLSAAEFARILVEEWSDPA